MPQQIHSAGCACGMAVSEGAGEFSAAQGWDKATGRAHADVDSRVRRGHAALCPPLYFLPRPNPAKVALLLEETGLAYETVPVDTRKGEQPASAFRAIHPKAKLPERQTACDQRH